MQDSGGSAPPNVRTCQSSKMGVEAFPLLHNHYRVLHVTVQQLYPTLVQVLARLLQPLIGHHMDPVALGKYTLYSLGYCMAGGVDH